MREAGWGSRIARVTERTQTLESGDVHLYSPIYSLLDAGFLPRKENEQYFDTYLGAENEWWQIKGLVSREACKILEPAELNLILNSTTYWLCDKSLHLANVQCLQVQMALKFITHPSRVCGNTLKAQSPK